MSQEATVLLIEDESEIRRFLRTTLPTHGFRLYEAITGQAGLIEAKTRNPDLILLDLGLPDIDGTEVIRQVREWTVTPIIVLSAREHEQQKVAALDLGADDYVTKPFGINELIARIRAALRHAARPDGEDADSCFSFGTGRQNARPVPRIGELTLSQTLPMSYGDKMIGHMAGHRIAQALFC